MPTTQTEDKTETKMVEVELYWSLKIGVPYRYKDETLHFVEKEVNPYGTSLKVLVPVEATTSLEALKKYVNEQYQHSDTDIGVLSDLNIWDSENEKFVFKDW